MHIIETDITRAGREAQAQVEQALDARAATLDERNPEHRAELVMHRYLRTVALAQSAWLIGELERDTNTTLILNAATNGIANLALSIANNLGQGLCAEAKEAMVCDMFGRAALATFSTLAGANDPRDFIAQGSAAYTPPGRA